MKKESKRNKKADKVGKTFYIDVILRKIAKNKEIRRNIKLKAEYEDK